MVSIITVFGILGLVGGGMNYFFFTTGLQKGLIAMINLEESGFVFPAYMDPPFPTISTYYLYEITNPKQVLKGAKMEFKLRGPYKFKTYLKRWNIEFRQSNEILKYDTARKLVYDEENSAKDIDEKFWLLNPTIPGVQSQVRNIVIDRLPFQRVSEPIVFNSVNVLLDNFKERLITKKSPRDILEGQKVEMLEFITGVADRFGLGSLVPPGPPDNVFGLAYVQNETTDTMEVWTGIKNRAKFADIHSWNGRQKLTTWSGACNSMNGTNGELYKPYMLEAKPIKVFLAQLCRSFYMMPVSGVLEEGPYGIKVYEYQLSPHLFHGVRTHPKNKCFCKNTKTYDCQYDGLLSMGPCFFDSPLFFAKGNLKDVDRKIKNLIADETVIYKDIIAEKQSVWLEPMSGSPLRANLTLTALFKVVRQPYMRDLANVRNISYVPFFAVSETVVLPWPVARPLKYLQMINDNYKPASLILAAGGTGILLMKFFGSFLG